MEEMGIRRMAARGNDDDEIVHLGAKLNCKNGGEIGSSSA
jgi:hypothetical protein